jgi:tRNA-2-methylthio-N6-dimethylallyladenosine synthase
MLRRMNRKYTRAQFEEKLSLFRRYLPHWAVTTDIIVGFPGENDADFEATMELVEAGAFANAFTFIYSIRRGTPAASWEQVPGDVSAPRFKRLIDAQNAATRAYHDCKIGTTVRALIVGPSKKDPARLAAKALDNVTVIAPMPAGYVEAVYAREPWLDIEIETAHVWGAMGTIVRRAQRYDDAGVTVERPVIDLIAG